jgi:hypothetical protein
VVAKKWRRSEVVLKGVDFLGACGGVNVGTLELLKMLGGVLKVSQGRRLCNSVVYRVACVGGDAG